MTYIRDDLATNAGKRIIEDWMEEIRIDAHAQRLKETAFQLGSLKCTLNFFDNAAVVNLHHDTETGIAAFFEPGSVDFSRSFIEECRDVLEVKE